MRPAHAFPTLLIAAAFALAGCGGGSSDSSGSGDGGSASSTPAQTQTDTGGSAKTTTQTQQVDGADVFASAGCASCHTLAAAGAKGVTGPNLDDLKPDAETVKNQVENGGGGMPAFGGDLSHAEIDAVARYVADNAGG